jgi:hypothetical protein
MPRPGGALNRSLQALTIGVVKGVQAREKALSRTTLGDLVQHQQLDIAGYIGKDPHTYVFSVGWDIPFVYAPMQHDSDLERPHFNYGVELGQQPTTPMSAATPTDHPIIVCQIVGWHDDHDGFTVAADVAVTSWIPGAKKKRQFTATAHLSFWGYGAPTDDSDDSGEDSI